VRRDVVEPQSNTIEDSLFAVAAWFARVGLYLLGALGVLVWVGYVVAVGVAISKESDALWPVIGVGLVLALAVDVCLAAIAVAVMGAMIGFGHATSFGFFGVALYVILWVTFFPVMAVVSFFVGAAFLKANWRELLE